jgi:regulatory protein
MHGPQRPVPKPGRITAMRFQQRNPERVNLFVDGEFAMGLPAIEAARLHVGQQLNATDLERLAQSDSQHRLFDRALDFLTYRPRSVAEVRRFFREKAVDDEESSALLQKLQELGYLDDLAFARWWMENRAEFSPRGPFVLRQELRLKGVPDAIIAQVMDESSPAGDEVILQLARARARRLSGHDMDSFRRRLTSYLMRRGFSYDEVRPAVEQAWQERSEPGASDEIPDVTDEDCTPSER